MGEFTLVSEQLRIPHVMKTDEKEESKEVKNLDL
jgi:hypothetical protein